MAVTVHLLGTGGGFSDGGRTTTMLAFEADGSVLVVDCGGDAVRQLQAAGVALERIDALFVTHEHPDHCGGFPLFVEKIWLSGRARPIPVVGIAPAVSQARRLWECFETGSWSVPPLDWREVPHEEGALAWSDGPWHVTVAPGVHSVPVVGLRVEHRCSGRVIAYSCDTERCAPITRLAAGADLLLHEATGEFGGHTTAKQAAETALEAGARRLVLVHLPPDASEDDLAQARAVFPGAEYGRDLGRYEV